MTDDDDPLLWKNIEAHAREMMEAGHTRKYSFLKDGCLVRATCDNCDNCVHNRLDYDWHTDYGLWSCDVEEQLPDDMTGEGDCPCWEPYEGSERERRDREYDENMYRNWLEEQEEGR